MMWDHSSTSWNPARKRRGRGKHGTGTQAVDRAAAAGVDGRARRRSRSPSPTSRRPAGWRSRRRRGCSPPWSAPAWSSATPPGRTSPAACSGCTPPATTRGRSWSGWPGPRWSGSARRPPRPCTSRVTRGERVVQVAQVDSRYLLGTRDWTEIEVPPHTSSLGKVFYAWGALPVPTAALHALHRRHRHRPRRAASATASGPASAARRSRSTSSRSASPASPYPSTARAATSSPRSASRDPPHGSRTGSTSSVATCRPTPRSCPRCCAAEPHPTSKEGVA